MFNFTQDIFASLKRLFSKRYVPNFIVRNKPNKYMHYIMCHKLSRSVKDLKYMYDVRFSLLVQSMLRNNNSISKEGLAEVNIFMTSLLKEIEVGNSLYLQNSDLIVKWCMENNIKIDK